MPASLRAFFSVRFPQSAGRLVRFMRKLGVVAKKREMKVRIPAASGLARFVLGPFGRFLVVATALFAILGIGIFTFFTPGTRV